VSARAVEGTTVRATLALSMFDRFLGPLRSRLTGAQQEPSPPLRAHDRETLAAVDAIRQASESIERYAQTAEVLANSIQPLSESLDELTKTAAALVAVVAAAGNPEDGVESLADFFGPQRDESRPPRNGGAES
jgi:hypothetical protein